jgi:hypothetical protein
MRQHSAEYWDVPEIKAAANFRSMAGKGSVRDTTIAIATSGLGRLDKATPEARMSRDKRITRNLAGARRLMAEEGFTGTPKVYRAKRA